MSQENKKFGKPALKYSRDRDGRLSEQDLTLISGGDGGVQPPEYLGGNNFTNGFNGPSPLGSNIGGSHRNK